MSQEVNPQLRELYNRYRFMFVALCLSGFLPVLTLIFLYMTGPGLGYLGNKMTFVFVIFIFQVPLCGALGYLLGIKRMRFLKRSSYLVQRGNSEDVRVKGIYKIKGQGDYMTCCADLLNSESESLERQWVIPSPAINDLIMDLPDLQDNEPVLTNSTELETYAGYIDKDTGKITAIEYQGKLLFFSPPVELF